MMENVISAVACPVCGGSEIGVKDAVIQTPLQRNYKKVWAFCRRCGRKGPETICTLNDSDSDEISAGYKSWNDMHKERSTAV